MHRECNTQVVGRIAARAGVAAQFQQDHGALRASAQPFKAGQQGAGAVGDGAVG